MTARPIPRLVSAGPCRLCGAPLTQSVIDLGHTSPAAPFPSPGDRPSHGAPGAPPGLYVCGSCTLVQIPDAGTPRRAAADDFGPSPSCHSAWHDAAREGAHLIERFGLDGAKRVIDIAGRNAALLATLQRRGISVLGIQPTPEASAGLRQHGIETVVASVGAESASALAQTGKRADLLLANDALALEPDLNGIVAGLKILLAPSGVLAFEFRHMLRLMHESRFDAAIHKQISYFSLTAAERLLARHGLAVFDVEAARADSGALRVLAGHDAFPRLVTGRVASLREEERDAGLHRPEACRAFGHAAHNEVRRRLRALLASAKHEGKTVVGYGAPDTGTTLLTAAGMGETALLYTVDRNPLKQGRFLPGTRIPVYQPEKIRGTRPNYILVLTWDLKEEIHRQVGFAREWGGRLVFPLPRLRVLE